MGIDIIRFVGGADVDNQMCGLYENNKVNFLPMKNISKPMQVHKRFNRIDLVGRKHSPLISDYPAQYFSCKHCATFPANSKNTLKLIELTNWWSADILNIPNIL